MPQNVILAIAFYCATGGGRIYNLSFLRDNFVQAADMIRRFIEHYYGNGDKLT